MAGVMAWNFCTCRDGTTTASTAEHSTAHSTMIRKPSYKKKKKKKRKKKKKKESCIGLYSSCLLHHHHHHTQGERERGENPVCDVMLADNPITNVS
jgi:hypothetical protein